MTATEWRPVAGFEGLYVVSNTGRVRSLPRSGTRRDRMYGGHDLKPARQISGHLAVSLSHDNQGHTQSVHVLVCEAFHGPRPEGSEVRHLNGNPADNRALNLVWGTRSENELDKVRHGTHHLARKTHCPQGHPYEGANLIIARRGDGSAFRQCRTCLNAASRRSKGRAKAQTYNLRPSETGGPA